MTRAVTLVIHRRASQPAPVEPQRTPEPDSELLRPMSQTEAAEWLGIDPTTLSLWTRGYQVPFVRVGAKPRYLKADLLEWMRTNASELVAS